VPFTPPVQICYALDEALDELAEHGGVAARVADYTARAALVRQGFAELGLQQLLPQDTPHSNALTVVLLPAGLSYTELYKQPPEGAWLHHLRRTGHAGQPGVPRGHHGRTIAGDAALLPGRAWPRTAHLHRSSGSRLKTGRRGPLRRIVAWR